MRNPEVVNRLFGFKMMLLSLVAILLLLMLMPKSNDWIEGGLLVPFYFALVLSICNLNDKLTAVLGNRFFIFLGEISYSVYILQLPVILVFKYVYQIDKFTDVSQFFWYSAILVMVSAILFYIVERPMQKWILGLFNREKNALAFK
jgi:peptidoglycan/LPS O-acetylase OafA/YrhL